MSSFTWQLKFVVQGRDAGALARDVGEDAGALARDVGEIETLLTQLAVARTDRACVLLMPECVDPGALTDRYRALTRLCVERGFRVGERLHIALFGHTPGT